MNSVHIWVDTTHFLKAFDDLRVDVLGAAEFALREVLKVAKDDARSTKKFQDQTGRLRGRIDTRQRGNEGSFFARTSYAAYLEGGTGLFGPRREAIRPKNAQALRFVIGGQVFFRKSVKGVEPMHFMRDAASKAESRFPDALEHYLDRAVRVYENTK